ncbi:MAG: hypothetical protein QOF58_2713, partial [Pseudonocardiales bacterium]|nr:hypothetical protein [Pseudonocardiales bacterium]
VVERLYLPWLGGHKMVAALVRPVYYVFGFAKDRADLPELVRELTGQLPLL